MNKNQKTTYVILRTLLFVLFIGGVLWFAFRLTFPRVTLQYNSAINSLANTIKAPQKDANQQTFDAAVRGDFSHARVQLTSPEDLSGQTLSARKGYRAFFAPIIVETESAQTTVYRIDDTYYLAQGNQPLQQLVSKNAALSYVTEDAIVAQDPAILENAEVAKELAGFASGALLASKDGIFVTSGDRKHAIDDETTFRTLGYDFDTVVKTDSEERSAHKKAKIFTLSATHPAGTIFHAEDNDAFYRSTAEALVPVANESFATTPITVTEEQRTTTASCTLVPARFQKDVYTCTLPLADLSSFSGNIYAFDLLHPEADLAFIRTTFHTIPNQTNFLNRTTEIKKQLLENYGQ